MSDYIYTDANGSRLHIGASSKPGADVYLDAEVHIPAVDLPEIVAKLYEAAGRPNPIADRPGQHVMQSVLDRRDLVIEPSIRAEGAVYFGQSSARGWHIRVEDLPELVGALYEAAGQEPPIILPRRVPEMSWVTDDALVRPLFVPGDRMTPAEIRDLCSWYASAADLADAEAERQRQEAEREQVEEICELILQSGAMEDSIWAAGRAEKIARAILSAGYVRTEGTA
ncbi:hypothetical protein ABZ917_17930 [Nonomuraea wenchangensis]